MQRSAFPWPNGRPLAVALTAVAVAGLVCVSDGRCAESARTSWVNAVQAGAVPDGETVNTESLQKAIDRLAASGGGTLYFPAGRYRTGTLVLRSHVTLRLDSGAVLLGSTDLSDYPDHVPAYRSYTDNYTCKSLLYAEGAENIAIVGRGTIDGQGTAFSGPFKRRPYLIRLIECRNVTLRDVTLQWSPMWTLHLLACEDVVVDGLRIQTVPPINRNNDGIDVDSCWNVRIANCLVRTQDDAIVLKSTSPRPCRNVTITNCVLSSRANAFKLGTESVGGFQNVVLSNTVIYDTGFCGLALELVDGGVFDQVSISNVVMRKVRSAAIFIRLGNRARPWWVPRPGDKPEDEPPRPGMGSLQNILISNVQATDIGPYGCSITGIPGHPVRNVTLRNVRMQFVGGGTAEEAKRLDVPEREDAYPECRMFGRLPAYGFYCRHVEGLTLRDLQLRLAKEDARPPLVLDDVRQAEISGLSVQVSDSADCAVRVRQVDQLTLRATRPPTPLDRLLSKFGPCGRVTVVP